MNKPLYHKCKHCYTFSKDTVWLKQHEKLCTYNPENKHCDSCKFRKLIIDEEQGSREYICEKGFEIDRTKPGCNSENWKLATVIQLQKRSNKKEFEV